MVARDADPGLKRADFLLQVPVSFTGDTERRK